MEVFKYSCEWEKEWDEFVETRSVNGTFLQTRRFMNYHPKGRFEDCSIIFWDKGKIKAVCPACEQNINGLKEFFSHRGMTFGGIILEKNSYRTDKVFELLELLEKYLKQNGFNKVILKTVPDIFSEKNMALLEYALQYYGYQEYKELNSYVNLKRDIGSIWNGINRNKKRALKKAFEQNMVFRELRGNAELEKFYLILKKNLAKHGVSPIHSLEEIIDFANYRLKSETKFYGIFHGEFMLAAGMLFSFGNTKILHAQNLSADTDYMDSGAITLLYYSVILEAKKMGYNKLSWGISTEENGEVINKGLILNKESYGSEYYINRTFVKLMSE